MRAILGAVVLFLGLAAVGCPAPEVVIRAEVSEAVIFDSVSSGFRDWVAALPSATPEQAAAKTEMLRVLDQRRSEYRSIHERLRAYLETDAFVKAFEASEPTLKEYLDWLSEKL